MDDKIDTAMTADPNINYSIIHDVIEKPKKTHMTSKLVKYNKYKCDGPGWVVWKESNNKYTIAIYTSAFNHL